MNPLILKELQKLVPHDFDLLSHYKDPETSIFYPHLLLGKSRIIAIDSIVYKNFMTGAKLSLKRSRQIDDVHKQLLRLSELLPIAQVQGALISVERNFKPFFSRGILVSPLNKFNLIAKETQLNYDVGGRFADSTTLRHELEKVLEKVEL